MAGGQAGRRSSPPQLAVVGADHPPRPLRPGQHPITGNGSLRSIATGASRMEPARLRQQLDPRAADRSRLTTSGGDPASALSGGGRRRRGPCRAGMRIDSGRWPLPPAEAPPPGRPPARRFLRAPPDGLRHPSGMGIGRCHRPRRAGDTGRHLSSHARPSIGLSGRQRPDQPAVPPARYRRTLPDRSRLSMSE